ncbi:dnaJ domain-containing protein [Pochonia chlamydosporia 170]|uniref:DnaJ domain-containing protein n=1 Tax=Pochonia chlamydosporia 170 TaxID=1380566 RepID=A0A179F4A6_METCM|nr:dnaJ domain-containing protein [Pochonia chlamydosporia 170]OAQ60201.1 dnaJ domain-containing protein [Pochonia chlamydosporia 170]
MSFSTGGNNKPSAAGGRSSREPPSDLTAPIPVKARSRRAPPPSIHDADEDDATPPVPQFSEGRQVLKACDPRLRMAFSSCINDLAQEFSRKGGMKRWEDLLVPMNQVTITERIMTAIGHNNTLNRRETETMEGQIQQNANEIALEIFLHSEKSHAEQHEPDISTDEGKRAKLSELIGMIQSGADHYQILGISRSSPEKDVRQAYRRLAVICHSDKAGHIDEDAKEITQALNNARDILCDKEERKKYDNELTTMDTDRRERPTFGESFASNAYSWDNDTGNKDDPPSESSSTQVPTRSQEILEIHSKVTEVLNHIFASRSPPSSEHLRNIRILDRQIEDTNIAQGVDDKAYQVNYNFICSLHKDMNRQIDNIEKGATTKDEAHRSAGDWHNMLKDHFQKNQQSVQWADIVCRLLESTIKEMSDNTEGTGRRPSTWTPFKVGGHKKNNGSQMARPSKDDTSNRNRNMPGFGGKTGKPNEREDNMSVDFSQEVPIREYPGPGYTRRGHKILGYRPVYRIFMNRLGEEERVLAQARFLVEDDEDDNNNFLRALDMDEVGKGPATDYDRLPEAEKNDLRVSHGRYKLINANEFKRIVGIDFIGQGSIDRSAATWVQVELHNEPDAVLANKPHLMTRSELKEWLGKKTGDYEIDQYLTKKNMVPPWAIGMGLEIYSHGYTKLNFPHPAAVKKQQLREMQYGGLMQYQNPMNHYNPMRNHSRYLPQTASQSLFHQQPDDLDDLKDKVEALTAGFQKLLTHIGMSSS